MNIIKKTRGIVWFLAILICPLEAFSWNQSPYSAVDMEIISDRRGRLPRYAANSERDNVERSYIQARNNERYRIRVSNRTNRRVGVVIAVDGRNIISGRKSHLQANERMYILGPYQSQEYDGWRTGKNRTNRFYFTEVNDSYAADWGDYSAMGVVALAVFQEREQRIRRQDRRNLQKDKSMAKSKRSYREPGTGFGEEQWSPSREVRFVAEKRADSKKFIKYEYRESLCRKGIIPCRQHKRENRFWNENRRNQGYAPHPSWFFNLLFSDYDR